VAGLAEFRSVIKLHRQQLIGLMEKRGVGKLRALYADAQADVQRKLRALARTGRGNTFTAHHYRMVLVQIKDGIDQIEQAIARHLGREARSAGLLAHRQVIAEIKAGSKTFAGHAPVLRAEQAAVAKGLYDNVEPSLIRRHQASARRYGPEVTRAVEHQMALSMTSGDNVGEAIDRVQDTISGERWRAERIVRCLPGETVVTGAVVGAAHRHWYEGPMVEIVTDGGGKLSATPNHPMLTSRGWVKQGLIAEGDYLTRYGRQENAGPSGHENVARGPTPIGQIFDALAAIGVAKWGRAGKPDFDGQRPQGDVDISCTDSLLYYGDFAELTEPLCQQLFSQTDLGNYRFCPACAALLPDKFSCLCQGPYSNSLLSQAAQNCSISDVVGLSDIGRAFPCKIPPFDLVQRQLRRGFLAAHLGPLEQQCFVERSVDAGLLDSSFDHLRPQSGFYARLSEAESAAVKLDRVKKKRTVHFAGHVFNLSTPFGYYHANGFFTGNTEMSYSFGVVKQASMEAVQQEVPRMQKRLVATWDDRTGDDSKQLDGQTVDVNKPFVWHVKDSKGLPTGKVVYYMQPPNRPNDREVVIPWRPEWGDTIGGHQGAL